MRSCQTGLAIFLALATSSLLASNYWPNAPVPEPPAAVVKSERVGDYRIRWQVRPAGPQHPAFLKVTRGGKGVYFEETAFISVGQGLRSSWTCQPGTDVTGRGQPDLVFESDTGGNACCTTLRILELGPKLRQVCEIRTGGVSDFRDRDGDGLQEIAVLDRTFVAWRCCNADSPMPRVILRLEGDRYVPDASLMRRPSPTAAQMADLVTRARKKVDDGGDPTAAMSQVVVHLLYEGNDASARRFLEKVEPDPKTRERFHHDVLARARTSPYWPAVAELNGMR